jgi:hypothetical protein
LGLIDQKLSDRINEKHRHFSGNLKFGEMGSKINDQKNTILFIGGLPIGGC